MDIYESLMDLQKVKQFFEDFKQDWKKFPRYQNYLETWKFRVSNKNIDKSFSLAFAFVGNDCRL